MDWFNMTYELTMKCGHKEKVSIKGPKKFKEEQANHLQKYDVCNKCKGERNEVK